MKKDNGDIEEIGPGYEGVGEFYDLFAENDDIPFYLAYASKQGSPILDIAAGTGRVTFELARKGFEVHALEKSPSMLAVARKRHSEAQPEIADHVTITEGDMRNFDLNQQFALIIIPGSFSHAITTQDQISTLRCVRKHLRNDGIFILDLYPGASQHEHVSWEDNPVELPDGRIVIRSGEINTDKIQQTLRVNLTYKVTNPNGDVIEEIDVVSNASIIYDREADLLVRMSGLVKEEEFGGFDKSPYTPDSTRRIFVLKPV